MAAISFTKILHDAVGVEMEESEVAKLDAQSIFQMFKVEQLKSILKHCRDKYSYSIRVSQNKKGLAEELCSIFSGATSPHPHPHPPLTTAAPAEPSVTSVNNSATYRPTQHVVAQRAIPPQPFVPHIPLESFSSSSSSLRKIPGTTTIQNNINNLFAQNQGRHNSENSDSNGRCVSIPSSFPATQQQCARSSLSVAPPAVTVNPTPHPSDMLRTDMSCYQDVHDELLQWGCFSSSQLVAAIRRRVQENRAVTQDLVANDLLGGPIMPTLSEEERAAQEEQIQRQFEEDMDKAILNSEEGRDHIQACKKQRTKELKTDHACLIGEAKEFRDSFLLGKRGTRGKSLPDIVHIVKEIVIFLDSMSKLFPGETSAQSESRSGSSGGCICSSVDNVYGSGVSGNMLNIEALQEVREVTFTLLELEMNSFKWYKESALEYFIDMEQKIAKACGVVTNKTDFKKLLTHYVHTGEGCSKDQCDFTIKETKDEKKCVQTVLKCLQGEVERLQQVLFSLSGTSVPQAFLDCDPDKKHEAKYSVEDDGFEIL